MDNVIQFERFKDVTGWDLQRINQYMRDHGWKGFKNNFSEWLREQDSRMIIERLPK